MTANGAKRSLYCRFLWMAFLCNCSLFRHTFAATHMDRETVISRQLWPTSNNNPGVRNYGKGLYTRTTAWLRVYPRNMQRKTQSKLLLNSWVWCVGLHLSLEKTWNLAPESLLELCRRERDALLKVLFPLFTLQGRKFPVSPKRPQGSSKRMLHFLHIIFFWKE